MSMPVTVQLDSPALGSWGASADGASATFFAFDGESWDLRGTAPVQDGRVRGVDPAVPEALVDALNAKLAEASDAPGEAPFARDAFDLILAHSAASGTTIETVVPDDRRWNEAIHNLRAGFKWYREEARWYRQKSIGTARPTLHLEGAAQRLRSAGARVYVEPVVEVSAREAAAIQREHLLGRAERYDTRADAHAQAGQALVARGRKMLERIPFGQPIHVGHHSERGDRNFRARIGTTYEKGFAELDTAEALARRAASRELAAEALSDAALDLRDAQNEFVDALLDLTSKRLKADVGASLVRTHRGDAKTASATIFLRYKTERQGAREIRVERDGSVVVYTPPWSAQGVQRVGHREQGAAAVYDAIVAALPHDGPTDKALRIAQDPALAASELVTYAMRRLKRAVDAERVAHTTRAFSEDMNAPRVPTGLCFWSNARRGEDWEFFLHGTTLYLRYSRCWGCKRHTALKEDVGAQTVPEIFDKIVQTIRATRAAYGPLPPPGQSD